MFTPIDRRVELMVDTIAAFISNYEDALIDIDFIAPRLMGAGKEKYLRLTAIRAGMRQTSPDEAIWLRGNERHAADLTDHPAIVQIVADWMPEWAVAEAA